MIDKEFNQPAWNIFYYNGKLGDIEKEVGSFLNNSVPNPKFYSNDLRHQYTSALFARNLGANTAKRFGELNEIFNLSGSGTKDSKIDRINNDIGIEYGLKYKDIPKNELLYKLLTDHSANVERRNKRME